jgi:phage shock protein PspC (stress-responsive transcriptional regulator)
MNGTSRLYRSTSEAMLGGVASGLGNYFKIDPVIVRGAFVILTLFTCGGFILAYLAMWLLIPTAGSTASQPGEIVQENLNDMGARVRSFAGGYSGSGANTTNITNTQPGAPANGNGGNGNGGNGNGNGNGGNGQTSAPARPGVGPMLLIAIGGFFLLANLGIFHRVYWGMWWPLLLIGLGVLMFTRRGR